MTDGATLEFDRLPPVAPLYLKALIKRSGRLEQPVPDLVARIKGLRARPEHLVRYRKCCGFAPEAHLPVTYPHVLAFPMQLAVLTHRAFPLSLPGLIHTRNLIDWQRPIGIDETFDLTVSIDGPREVSKGIEFDLITRVTNLAGDALWGETSTMLARRKRSGRGSAQHTAHSANAAPKLDFTPRDEAAWQVPADIGRRYAAAAGDYNPIHLGSWPARLFGFPRAIATGMWLQARVAAALHMESRGDAGTLDVSFKKPVLLPATVVFRQGFSADGIPFALTSTDGDIHHLIGEFCPADAS